VVCTLQLNERETATGTNLSVVFDRWAPNDGSEQVYRARSDLGNLRNTSIPSRLLLARLSGS
jgi:hypothetical protein